ncbi:unnamed protein product [Merluccius merluccius]
MSTSSALSITEQVQKEIELYKGMPAIPSGQDPVAWWLLYLPEEVKGQNDLQWSRPDHVDVSDEVHKALGIH